MSKTYLVSIVSEQTLPNYLFIKEFQEQVDKFIFITTREMEAKDKVEAILSTAKIRKDNRIKITVEENALYKAKEKLNRALPNISTQDSFLINLTGGTKMMSIAVYEYFKRFPNSRFFYVPIGKNVYREIFENQQAKETSFKYKISVREYLSIYGISYESLPLLFTEDQVEDLFRDVHSTQYDLEHFPKGKVKKYGIKDFQSKQVHTKWFEEFLYYRIKGVLNLIDDNIKTGLRLKGKNLNTQMFRNDNEIDIFFIYDNNPFLVEAKFSIGREKINIATLNNYLFKLVGVNRRFGLNIRSIVMTLSDLDTLGENAKQALEYKTRLLKVAYPFGRRDIVNKETFKHKLLKFVK